MPDNIVLADTSLPGIDRVAGQQQSEEKPGLRMQGVEASLPVL